MKGVMLLTYGTPATLKDVEAYYTHIRGGRRPSPEQLAELTSRYEAIGGSSPLIRITQTQGSKLQARLKAKGSFTRVYCGMKHSRPFVADAMQQAAKDGVTEMLGIPLTPHYSMMNTETYVLAVETANTGPSRMKLDFVRSWNTNPILVDAWVERVKSAQARLPPKNALIFSAHSLPEKTLEQGDQYRNRLLETSETVASRVGRKDDWSFAFQSAGRTGEKWLGPDIIEHLQGLYDDGERSFLIAPVGFVSDHLEVLYDIDVECAAWAKEKGATLVRTRMLNDSDDFIDCLYSIVEERGFA